MGPDISEFSFGYCLTEELMRGLVHGLRGAPIFPTQRQEGERGGYDVEIPRDGIPLFIQFKLSCVLTRSNANEWNLHGRPYYRMYIRPRHRSNQHRFMYEWEVAGNEIYYAAPIFHTQEELSYAYNRDRVIHSTAFFRPRDIGLLQDNATHYVSFVPGAPDAYFHSKDPKPIAPPVLGFEKMGEFSQTLDARRVDFDERFFSELIDDLRDVSQFVDGPLLTAELFERQGPKRDDAREQTALRAALVSWSLLDAQLFLIHDGA